jgi:hypothetical protein
VGGVDRTDRAVEPSCFLSPFFSARAQILVSFDSYLLHFFSPFFKSFFKSASGVSSFIPLLKAEFPVLFQPIVVVFHCCLSLVSLIFSPGLEVFPGIDG